MPARQPITTPDTLGRGDQISAGWLNGILDRVFAAIRFGPGLQGQRMGGQLLITTTATQSRAIGNGVTVYSAAYKSSLPTDVSWGSLGYTTDPTQRRAYIFLDAQWICLTHFEAPD